MPFVVYGNENFNRDIRQYKRTQMSLRAGKPFRLQSTNTNPDRQTRQELTDAIMYEIAGLLPQSYRGKYADTDGSHQRYLEFLNLSS
jgi:hypothetical protein